MPNQGLRAEEVAPASVAFMAEVISDAFRRAGLGNATERREYLPP